MEDFFALLGEERRPALDAEALKAKYHHLTAEQHPDVTGENGEAFARINHAYTVLSEPGSRLRHLLEVETGAPAARLQGVPEIAAGYFEPVGKIRQRVEDFFRKRAAAVSPLAQALLAAEQFDVQEDLGTMLEELDAARDRVLARVSAADALWAEERPAAVAMLGDLWQSLSYLDKWLAALREDLFRFAAL